MSDKDRLDLFYSQCSNYRKYQIGAIETKEEIKEIDRKLMNLKSPNLTEPMGEGSGSSSFNYDLLARKDKLIKKLENYEYNIRVVDEVYNKLEDEVKGMVYKRFIDKKETVERLASEHYMDKKTMYRAMRIEILKYI